MGQIINCQFCKENRPLVVRTFEHDLDLPEFPQIADEPSFIQDSKPNSFQGVSHAKSTQPSITKQSITDQPSKLKRLMKKSQTALTFKPIFKQSQVEVIEEQNEEEDYMLLELKKIQAKLISKLGLFEEKYKNLFSSCPFKVVKSVEDNTLYYGQWVHEMKFGYGQIYDDSGNFYEGYWLNDQRHFFGRSIDSNGNIYVGQWFSGEPIEKGTYIQADGSEKMIEEGLEELAQRLALNEPQQQVPEKFTYFGSLWNSERHGLGLLQKYEEYYYVGEFKNNQITGYGMMMFQDGRCYRGKFKDGKFHGMGQFTYPDGRMYVGSFYNDMKQGHGLSLYYNGNIFIGYFRENLKHGLALMIDAQGNVKETNWVHDRPCQESAGNIVIIH